MEGHGDYEPLTAAQVSALSVWLAAQCVNAGLTDWAADVLAKVPILGHRDFPGARKACPGKLVNLDPIVAEVRDLLNPREYVGPSALPWCEPGPEDERTP